MRDEHIAARRLPHAISSGTIRPMNHLEDFRPSPRHLFASGPGVLPARVQSAMSAPILSHLDPQFHGVLGDIAASSGELFGGELLERGRALEQPVSDFRRRQQVHH